MALIAKDSGCGDFERCPTGLMQAVCCHVVDLGMHLEDYGDGKKNTHKCMLVFETRETMTGGEYDGKPFMLSKEYTVSLHEKANLRKYLEGWRGKAFTLEELEGFDIETLVGVNGMINVVEKESKGKTYSNIGSISPLMKGLNLLTPSGVDVPKWIKDKINLPGDINQEFSDDIPLPDPSDERPANQEPPEDLPF